MGSASTRCRGFLISKGISIDKVSASHSYIPLLLWTGSQDVSVGNTGTLHESLLVLFLYVSPELHLSGTLQSSGSCHFRHYGDWGLPEVYLHPLSLRGVVGRQDDVALLL